MPETFHDKTGVEGQTDGQVVGGEVAGAMEEVVSGVLHDRATRGALDGLDEAISAELDRTEVAYGKLFKWAADFGYHKEWVMKNFHLNPGNATWEITRPISFVGISNPNDFPPNISRVNGSLYLRSLTSAQGLVLPKEVDGDLDLCRITSYDGLILPMKVRGEILLDGLPLAEVAELRRKYPRHRIVWRDEE